MAHFDKKKKFRMVQDASSDVGGLGRITFYFSVADFLDKENP